MIFRTKKRIFALLCSLLFTTVAASADVLKVVVNDTINPITAEYIGRAIDQAKQEKADAVLIELRTPGGLVDSTRTIIEKILASDVPVIVYVTPSGGYAASAGFFILESADIAAMAPGTNAGAAHPVLSPGVKLDDVMKQKMENDAAALMRSFVSKRGRNVEVAESAVFQSKSFTEQEAFDKKLIDVISPDERDLLNKLDGREISRFDGKKYTLHVAGKTIRPFEMTLKQQILGFLMDPNIAYILFSIGMLALYAEFNNPGAVVPGVVGLIFILLAIFAFNLLPTRFAALALIVAAFIMFGLEVKFASHGVLGIGGTVMMVIGALLLVDGPIPEMRIRLLTALSVSVPIALVTIFLMSIAYKARMNKVITGEEGMLGEIGTAQTALAPEGKVFVHGETWNAVCPEHAMPGDRIQVTQVQGLHLQVARLETQKASAQQLKADRIVSS
ncbi:MAG: Nodulation efficiency protein NfeD [Candidatus Angelobacter sp.]|nr:Nodulation efficiency protein NfeD [Candidatus Angelobacter sp.]